MSGTSSRRTFLAGVGVTGLIGIAGCVDKLGSHRGTTDVIIHNEAEVPRTVEVTVGKRGGGKSSSINTSLDMKPHSKQKINNEVIMGSDYVVDVIYTDDTGQSPYKERQEWTDAGRPLHILLDDGIVFATQIG